MVPLCSHSFAEKNSNQYTPDDFSSKASDMCVCVSSVLLTGFSQARLETKFGRLEEEIHVLMRFPNQ